MSNTIGTLFRLTTFGESHGEAIGGVIDGMPAGVAVDMEFIQSELNRRRPGQNRLTTQRNESDKVELLSGVFEGKTTGTPIGFIVKNENQRSQDYTEMADKLRPSHADFTYQQKYGVRDYRGGGRSSARITISRVVAGAFAKLALQSVGIDIQAFTSQIGDIKLTGDYKDYNISLKETNPVRCPDGKTAAEMELLIARMREEGDSVGGVVTAVITGCPAGLGEPEFGKLSADLAAAMMSINAAKGFEYGEGFDAATRKGSESNDIFCSENGTIRTRSNHSGGIQGGISNGEDIYFRVAFKPVATIMKEQETVDREGRSTTIKGKGRHDPCVVPRAVPIVESMAAIVILDHFLLNKSKKME